MVEIDFFRFSLLNLIYDIISYTLMVENLIKIKIFKILITQYCIYFLVRLKRSIKIQQIKLDYNSRGVEMVSRKFGFSPIKITPIAKLDRKNILRFQLHILCL